MPIYMKYGDIKGDVTAEGHKEWVELDSFHWGVGRSISNTTGRSSDRESSAPKVNDVTISKFSDVSSVDLLGEALQGEGKDVQLDFCKTDQGTAGLEAYTSLTLTNCMVSGFSFGSSGGGRCTETLGLNFTKVEYKSVAMDAMGAGGKQSILMYDIGLAKLV